MSLHRECSITLSIYFSDSEDEDDDTAQREMNSTERNEDDESTERNEEVGQSHHQHAHQSRGRLYC